MTETTRSVRLLGTSWKHRNVRYWIRRAALSLIAFLMAFFVGTFYVSLAAGLLKGASGNLSAEVAIISIFVIALLWSSIAAFNAYRPILAAEKSGNIEALRTIVSRRSTGKTVRSGAAGLGVGIGGFVGNSFATGLLAFGSVFIVGWPIVMFIMTLRRYHSAEECLAVLESRH